MGTIDFHCDTLMNLYTWKNSGDTMESLWKNRGHLDLERLVKSKAFAQFFACFLWLEGKPVKESHYEDALAMMEMFYQELENCGKDAAFAGSYSDYLKNREVGKLSAFLTVEEGGILENDLDRLNVLYDKGVRIITLTWNYENCPGFPNKDWKYSDKGLKTFGLEALEKMDKLGIAADVSHLSDAGFEDVYQYGKRPFIATHSNARSICGHPRNLTDDMIRKLAEKGGVMGLNLCGGFLCEDGKSTLEAMTKHLRHIIRVGGSEVACLGTDFDGVTDLLEIEGCQQMGKLEEAMESAGFTGSEIDGICYKNAEKFMKNYWG